MVRPPRLRAGDEVRLVAPGGAASHDDAGAAIARLEGLGLRVSIGAYAFQDDEAQRVEDVNRALRDPGVRALVAARGSGHEHRIAGRLDFGTAAAHPKLLIAGTDGTILHLALWERSGLAGLRGDATAAFSTEPAVVASDPKAATGELTTGGRARGVLLGGDQDQVAAAAGWMLPSMSGAILLLEADGLGAVHVDRQLTMLRNAGRLDGLRGIAVGRYTGCGTGVLDVLHDRLGAHGVPLLGGLDLANLPVGTMAELDADAGTLTVDAAVS
ncbi:peptidase S66 [Paractinoplanes deccanensis]|uniref:Peptidase S66 n=1 Tax=Paractinoplanes deccanensis TaxID=113561 RepID=A0ABQ3XUT5_9ACTN|nr:peptidase S66 [Actinoplanes deccanensis]